MRDSGGPGVGGRPALPDLLRARMLSLTAGRSHAVRLEFYEHGGHAVARLSWRGARQAEQVVPAEPPGP